MTDQRFDWREALRSDRIVQMALRSPVGAVFASAVIDRPALWGIADVYMPLSRLWAAAHAARGSVGRFLEEVPLAGGARRTDAHIRRVVGAFEEARYQAGEAATRWEAGFFGEEELPPRELTGLELRRIRRAQTLLLQRLRFGYLFLRHRVKAVLFEIPSQDEVEQIYGHALEDPGRIYASPETMPDIEVSRAMISTAGRDYWLRFPAPSKRIGGTAWARVHEPVGVTDPPTFIFGNGIGVEFDHIVHSMEDIASLCRSGIRVVQIEWPWHGRRLAPGRYAGEPFFARAPLGAIDLFSAQVQELAVLVDWARRTSKGHVGIGGASLGALAAQLYAVHSANWHDYLRPDVLALITFCDRVHELPFKSALARKLGMDRALESAGWTLADCRRWAPLTDATGIPAVDPDNIVAILGAEDEVTPYDIAEEQVRRWGVPEANRFVRRSGHFSTPAGLVRDMQPLERLARLLTR